MSASEPAAPTEAKAGESPRPGAPASTGPIDAPARAVATRAPISSEHLFEGASEVQITHRGSLYRLKHTALGKLILTK